MYSDIRQLLLDIKNNWKGVAQRFQFAGSKFFYSEDFINLTLFNKSFKNLPRTTFIDYPLAFKYYEGEHKKVTLQLGEEQKELSLPYKEIISFVRKPDATIALFEAVDPFKLDDFARSNTQETLDTFLAERPKTINGSVLRLASLKKIKGNDYKAKIESASYFDSIRTNLGLDHQLDTDSFGSMRLEDLGEDNSLVDLSDSQMVNHIGISTVLAFESGGKWYFHMQPRAHKLGVFNGMLSSVGGTCEPPRGLVSDLVTHATKEIYRELREETGLDVEEIQRDSRFDIIPLALTRELIRGGKPQFFFLSVMGELTEKEFAKVFKNAEFKGEFRSDFLSNITSYDDVLSPELSANLIYALEYMQTKKKLPIDVIYLD